MFDVFDVWRVNVLWPTKYNIVYKSQYVLAMFELQLTDKYDFFLNTYLVHISFSEIYF